MTFQTGSAGYVGSLIVRESLVERDIRYVARLAGVVKDEPA